jgi:hypothetical protein
VIFLAHGVSVATQFIVCSVGIGDTPQQADLPKIPQGNFEQNRKVCTTLPCLPRYLITNTNNNRKINLPDNCKRKTLQNRVGCNASYSLFNYILDIHSSSVSTSLISFAVAVTIRNPLSLISSSRLSSCLRCVDLSVSLFGKKIGLPIRLKE